MFGNGTSVNGDSGSDKKSIRTEDYRGHYQTYYPDEPRNEQSVSRHPNSEDAKFEEEALSRADAIRTRLHATLTYLNIQQYLTLRNAIKALTIGLIAEVIAETVKRFATNEAGTLNIYFEITGILYGTVLLRAIYQNWDRIKKMKVKDALTYIFCVFSAEVGYGALMAANCSTAFLAFAIYCGATPSVLLGLSFIGHILGNLDGGATAYALLNASGVQRKDFRNGIVTIKNLLKNKKITWGDLFIHMSPILISFIAGALQPLAGMLESYYTATDIGHNPTFSLTTALVLGNLFSLCQFGTYLIQFAEDMPGAVNIRALRDLHREDWVTIWHNLTSTETIGMGYKTQHKILRPIVSIANILLNSGFAVSLRTIFNSSIRTLSFFSAFLQLYAVVARASIALLYSEEASQQYVKDWNNSYPLAAYFIASIIAAGAFYQTTYSFGRRDYNANFSSFYIGSTLPKTHSMLLNSVALVKDANDGWKLYQRVPKDIEAAGWKIIEPSELQMSSREKLQAILQKENADARKFEITFVANLDADLIAPGFRASFTPTEELQLEYIESTDTGFSIKKISINNIPGLESAVNSFKEAPNIPLPARQEYVTAVVKSYYESTLLSAADKKAIEEIMKEYVKRQQAPLQEIKDPTFCCVSLNEDKEPEFESTPESDELEKDMKRIRAWIFSPAQYITRALNLCTSILILSGPTLEDRAASLNNPINLVLFFGGLFIGFAWSAKQFVGRIEMAGNQSFPDWAKWFAGKIKENKEENPLPSVVTDETTLLTSNRPYSMGPEIITIGEPTSAASAVSTNSSALGNHPGNSLTKLQQKLEKCRAQLLTLRNYVQTLTMPEEQIEARKQERQIQRLEEGKSAQEEKGKEITNADVMRKNERLSEALRRIKTLEEREATLIQVIEDVNKSSSYQSSSPLLS